jgi:ABC-type dipeptide/oligopeptide/nickel transport system permease component
MLSEVYTRVIQVVGLLMIFHVLAASGLGIAATAEEETDTKDRLNMWAWILLGVPAFLVLVHAVVTGSFKTENIVAYYDKIHVDM